MRTDVIQNCFQVIQTLNTRIVTANELAEAMGVHTRTAYRYIDAISTVYPVYETEDYPRRFTMLKLKER